MKIFVYGSLRKDRRNHHLIYNIAEYVGRFYVKGSLYMVKNKYYPALVLENHDDYTIGELYVIDEKKEEAQKAIKNMDTLEHYLGENYSENEFNKVLVDVFDGNHQKIDAAYVYMYNIENNPDLKNTLDTKIKENDYMNIKEWNL